MYSQERNSSPRKKRRMLLLIALSISLLVVNISGVVPCNAQVTQESSTPCSQECRELEDRIPTHLPIKIKIRNLQNEHWMRDLEIEVTNKAAKPIYYLKLSVSMPDIKINGGDAGNMIRYGRLALIEFDKPILPEDVPIKPGETVVLKYPESDWRGWEDYAAKHNLPKSEPKKLKLMFHALNFGDGTGFSGTRGTPIPNPRVVSFLQEQKTWGSILASTNFLSGYFYWFLVSTGFLPLTFN